MTDSVISLLTSIKRAQEASKFELVTSLRKLRIEKGLLQESIFNIIGVSQSTYWSYEKGFVGLDISVAKKVADISDCTVSDLIDLRQEKNKTGRYLLTERNFEHSRR